MNKSSIIALAALIIFTSGQSIQGGPEQQVLPQRPKPVNPGPVLAELPDLVPYMYIEKPHWPREKQYTVFLTVSNKGNGDVRYDGPSEWIIYQVRVGHLNHERKTTSYQLAAGRWYSSGIHLFRVFDLKPGNYTITCQMDPRNFIPESNENNNTATLRLTIDKPDLISRDPRFNSDSSGQKLMISLINIGGPCLAKKDVVIARIFRPDKSFVDVALNREHDFTGMSTNVKLFDAGVLTPGNYPILVQMDPTNYYNESNENNNQKTYTLRIVGLQNKTIQKKF